MLGVTIHSSRGGAEILLLTSCNRNCNNLGSSADLRYQPGLKKANFGNFLISKCSDKAFQELSFIIKKIPQKNILSVQSYWTLKFTTR